MPQPTARPHALTSTLAAAAAALLMTGCAVPPAPVSDASSPPPEAPAAHTDAAVDSAPPADLDSTVTPAVAAAAAAPTTLPSWRLQLPPVRRGGVGLHVDLIPELRPTLQFGQPYPPARPAAHTAAWATPTAREPDGDAPRVSPRHAMLAFTSPSGTDTCLVALIGHLGRNGRPAPGGFCLEIREAAATATAQYAFEHPAGQLTLTTAAGAPLPGGRNAPASSTLTDVRVWPTDSRSASTHPLTAIAHFTPARSTPAQTAAAQTLRAWFTAQPHDELLTTTPRRAQTNPLAKSPGQDTRLLLRRRQTDQPTPTFVTVFEPTTTPYNPAAANPTAIHTVHTRVENDGHTRVITVATTAVVHTLVHHLADAPYISPDFSLDGRFAAISRTVDGRLIDAYLGDGQALVLPEHTLSGQDSNTRWAYARP